MFSNKEKNEISRAVKEVLRQVAGNVHCILEIDFGHSKFDVICEGIMTYYEKWLVERYGEDAIEFFIKFLLRDCQYLQMKFNELTGHVHPYELYDFQVDYYEDSFVFRMQRVRY